MFKHIQFSMFPMTKLINVLEIDVGDDSRLTWHDINTKQNPGCCNECTKSQHEAKK